MNGRAATRLRIKICGVTNRNDAETAIALGADALGFNLFPSSKRCISLSEEARWICELPPFVTKVAVLVKATCAEAAPSRRTTSTTWSVHGEKMRPLLIRALGRHFIKAFGCATTFIHEATRFSTQNSS